MSWTELIKLLLPIIGPIAGAVIGAIVAISGIWIKDILDNRKAAQSWYEQTYITEGIDRVLAYIKITELQITHLLSARQAFELFGGRGLQAGVENIPKDESSESYPLEALVRLEILLKNNIFTAVVTSINGAAQMMSNVPVEARSQVLLSDIANNLRQAYSRLEELREQLLQIHIKRKPDIHGIHKKSKVISAVKNLSETMDKWVANTAERDRLISNKM